MQYRRVGNAGMKVSCLSLGAWLTYGGSVNEEQAVKCIQTALAHGVNFLDNADVYSLGSAEELVGRVIRDYRRSDLVISSKVFWPMSDNVNDRGLSRKHIMESLHKSLKRLKTDYLDLYFAHRFDEETPAEEVVRAMDDLVRQGKVLYWGTSCWNAAQLEHAVAIAKQYQAYLPQVEQPKYNMLDRHIEPEILPTAASNGMGIMAFCPLAQGLLTGKYNDGIPPDSRGGSTNWLKDTLTEPNMQKVRRLSALAKEAGMELAHMALAWILRRPEVSCAIIGATRPEQVTSNLKAAEIKLDEELLKKIEGILSQSPELG